MLIVVKRLLGNEGNKLTAITKTGKLE